MTRRKVSGSPSATIGGNPVRRFRISDLVLDPRNPRTHGDQNLEVVRGSLEDYGQVEALVVQANTNRVDPLYKQAYDLFWTFPPDASRGSGPVRNFVWDHATSEGHKRHWVVDDNIQGFYRLNRNLKVPVGDGTVFRCMEDFVERYTNVAMAGPNYFMFASRKNDVPPFTLNTRIYSCNLILNSAPFRWRGMYNEDVDLSLRMLKEGFCTILFNAFLQRKAPTQTMIGGNTDAFYAEEGTLPKSQMLVDMHPDVARVAWRFGRWHHHVDYRGFKRNRLVRDPLVEVRSGPDDYGMVLKDEPVRKLPRS